MYLLSQVDLKLKWQDTSGFEKHQIFDKKGQPLYLLVGLNYFKVDVIVMRML
jgi:hypothetical protein